MSAREQFIVGIDLGTSHTALAYVRLGSSEAPQILALDQQVSSSERARLPLLASCLYRPPEFERRDAEPPWLVGQYARERGQELAGRLVQSAKSWLCHKSVDRQAKILPWASEQLAESERLSPVEASASILGHVREQWDREHPEAPLHEQQVVLTVPASFDQGARQLTVSAAEHAGLHPRLLEEPQAAFYDYLSRHGTAELGLLLEARAKQRSLGLLVCDVGGGTTDLSLLSVYRSDDQIGVDRLAVGRHLLLGGDNIDHALAHAVEAELAPGRRLEPSIFSQLVLKCRVAKEQLLGPAGPPSVRVSLALKGSELVGRTLTFDLTEERVYQIAVDGFFPRVEPGPAGGRRAQGLVTFGLPYERDPAVTRHVASFVARHGALGRLDALLVNGGVFHAASIRKRLAEVVAGFGDETLVVLEHTDPDLAVARGACVFGQALHGHGLRIGGGSAHGYYVGLATATERQLMCVVPRGAREAEQHVAETPLKLSVGQPARFELFASDAGPLHAPGELVPFREDDFEALPQVVAEFEADAGLGSVDVRVVGELTPLGTLDLECVETLGQRRRFQLAFELRGQEAPVSRAGAPRSVRETTPLAQADEAIARVFGKGRKDVKEREAKDLVRELERLLGTRDTWSAQTARALFDVIAPKHKARKRSPDHERVYFMLTGFCLRPGFGYRLDQQRISLLFPLFLEGLTFATEARSWQQFLICWRRVAGGLSEAEQLVIADTLEPFVAPEELKQKKTKGFKPLAPEEMIELLSRLERLPQARRLAFARWLLERTWTSRDPRLWAAIGRVGARVTAYGSVHQVLLAKHAEEFLDHLLRERWDELKSAPYAAMLLARRTEDRARDVSDALREEVLTRMHKHGVRPDFVECVQHFVPTGDRDRAEFLGEELPVGLALGPDSSG